MRKRLVSQPNKWAVSDAIRKYYLKDVRYAEANGLNEYKRKILDN